MSQDPQARAAGIGSMPGTDFARSLGMVLEQTPDLIALPELPARGVHAALTGRGVALLTDLGADLQPAGWRLTGAGTPSGGGDQRRAASLLRQDLDRVEELLTGYAGPLKVQVVGPWTLAATLERPRGDRILADHGGRREVAQSLAEGIREHLASVAARVPAATLVLQIDEPLLPAVLAAHIPTASGWGRHRAIGHPEADATLRLFSDLAHALGARAVLHSCAADLPVELVAGAGFDAVSFDASLVAPGDAWAAAFDAGLDLWPGVVPSTDTGRQSDKELIGRVERFFSHLGFARPSYVGRLVVTPTCGLAGASPDWARRALGLAHSVVEHL